MQPSTAKSHKADAKAARLHELSVPVANVDAMTA
jgi:hypothetical protein